jgi:hypothetical protein
VTAVAPPPIPSEVAKVAPREIALGGRGVELKSFEELFRLATAAVRAGFAPEGVKTPEQALVAMEYGMELGFTPMRALTVCPVVNGRPSVMGDAALALLRRDGLIARDEPRVTYDGDGDARVCTVSFPTSNPGISASFSVQDAKKAGLWGKRAWAGYPDWMLMWRATGRVCRVHFSDVLLGLPLAEEARDYPPVAGVAAAGPLLGAGPDPLLEAALGPQDVDTSRKAFGEGPIIDVPDQEAGEEPVRPGWRRLTCPGCGAVDDYPEVGAYGCTSDCGASVDEDGVWTLPGQPAERQTTPEGQVERAAPAPEPPKPAAKPRGKAKPAGFALQPDKEAF